MPDQPEAEPGTGGTASQLRWTLHLRNDGGDGQCPRCGLIENWAFVAAICAPQLVGVEFHAPRHSFAVRRHVRDRQVLAAIRPDFARLAVE